MEDNSSATPYEILRFECMCIGLLFLRGLRCGKWSFFVIFCWAYEKFYAEEMGGTFDNDTVLSCGRISILFVIDNRKIE